MPPPTPPPPFPPLNPNNKQVTCFVAGLALDARRVEQGRCDGCPCLFVSGAAARAGVDEYGGDGAFVSAGGAAGGDGGDGDDGGGGNGEGDEDGISRRRKKRRGEEEAEAAGTGVIARVIDRCVYVWMCGWVGVGRPTPTRPETIPDTQHCFYLLVDPPNPAQHHTQNKHPTHKNTQHNNTTQTTNPARTQVLHPRALLPPGQGVRGRAGRGLPGLRPLGADGAGGNSILLIFVFPSLDLESVVINIYVTLPRLTKPRNHTCMHTHTHIYTPVGPGTAVGCPFRSLSGGLLQHPVLLGGSGWVRVYVRVSCLFLCMMH